MRKTLTRSERLSRQSDLKTIFASGTRLSTSGAKIVYLNNNLSYSRFAITIVRKYGNAVERNRIKRFFRELYRLNKDKIYTGKDIILVLYPGRYSESNRSTQFFNLLKKANLYKMAKDSTEL